MEDTTTTVESYKVFSEDVHVGTVRGYPLRDHHRSHHPLSLFFREIRFTTLHTFQGNIRGPDKLTIPSWSEGDDSGSDVGTETTSSTSTKDGCHPSRPCVFSGVRSKKTRGLTRELHHVRRKGVLTVRTSRSDDT